MTWLDIGNGWRNIFLLSSLLQALALGTWFAVRGIWMKQHRVAAFLTGVAVTPFAQYLWMLLLSLVWAKAPKLFIIGVPPALAALYILLLLIKTHTRWGALLRGGWQAVRKLRIDRAAIIAVCFAAAMAVLLLPVCIRTATSAVAAQGDSGEYMGLALRYTETRDTAALFTKDDVQADYRGHSHFPSLELYMAYGLMHTSDIYGYPYDKPAFTAVGLLVFYLLAAFIALCLRAARGKLRWVMLGLLLFNLIPNLVYSFGGATRDAWRCLAVLLLALALVDLRPAKGWRMLRTAAFVFAVSFAAMSAHVVCFVIVPFVIAAWVALVWLEALATKDQPLRALLRGIGAALGGAAGVLLGFSGNLWCYLKWGEFSPWRIVTTYTNAPWYQTYLRMEYRLEETTTHLNFWASRRDIVMAHASPVGIWGMRLAVLAVVCIIVWVFWKRRRSQTSLIQTAPDMTLPTLALITLFTLAPMTGLLDSPLYSFSGTFIKLQRYTLQWYLFAAALLASLGAWAEDRWPAVVRRAQGRLRKLTLPAWVNKLPAYLCVLLCVCWFAEGTKVTGYTASFFRYGRPWLTDATFAQDNYMVSQYGTLTKFVSLLAPGQNLIIARENYQYPIHSRALLLTANPVAPILNLTLAQIPAALQEKNIVAVVSEPAFWDERFYGETTLSEYLHTLPTEQVIQEDGMRIWIIDPGLAAAFHTAFDTV